MSDERTIPRDDVAALLSSALGDEKSRELVGAAGRELGYATTAFSGEEVRALFAKLSAVEGLVGVVARFAISRGDVDGLVARAPARAPSSMRDPISDRAGGGLGAAGAASGAPGPPVDLLPLLAPALGGEKARDATFAAAARLALDPRRLTREQGLAVLDELTRQEGIVGVVARFAKARYLLTQE